MSEFMNDAEEVSCNQAIILEDFTQTVQLCKTMSGLEYWQAVRDEKLLSSPISTLIGIRITEISKGSVVLSTVPEKCYYSLFGTVQSGIVAALLDVTLGCAIHTTLQAGVEYTMIDMNVRYMRPLTRETGMLYCKGTVLETKGNIANIGASLIDKAEKLYAHATATCMIQSLKKKG